MTVHAKAIFQRAFAGPFGLKGTEHFCQGCFVAGAGLLRPNPPPFHGIIGGLGPLKAFCIHEAGCFIDVEAGVFTPCPFGPLLPANLLAHRLMHTRAWSLSMPSRAAHCIVHLPQEVLPAFIGRTACQHMWCSLAGPGPMASSAPKGGGSHAIIKQTRLCAIADAKRRASMASNAIAILSKARLQAIMSILRRFLPAPSSPTSSSGLGPCTREQNANVHLWGVGKMAIDCASSAHDGMNAANSMYGNGFSILVSSFNFA